jgi:1-deoxy-D-xylulose-5-phosphate synthase
MANKIERIDIKSIKDPSIVKKMSYSSLALLCHDIRKKSSRRLPFMAAILASNLGVVELTVALYRNFDFPKDKLIFDVGHQCYTHKILSGRVRSIICANGGERFRTAERIRLRLLRSRP